MHQRCLAGAIERNEDDRFERPDGSTNYIRWECRPWYREGGKIGGIILYTELITGRKKQEERMRMMSEMLDAAPCMIAVHDFEGRFLYANRHTSALHGYDHGDFMTVLLKDLMVPASKALMQERLRLIEQVGEATFEVVHFRRDGSSFPMEVIAKKVMWGGEPAFLGIATDITGRKRAEDQLRNLNTHLEEQRNRAEQLALEAQAAVRAKSEFLALMSHELRTPLNGVLGFTDLLFETRLDLEQKEFTRTISDSATHLLDVVNDILDFSSIEKGRMPIRVAKIRVEELVISACRPVRNVAVNKGLEFCSDLAPDVPSEIIGDMRRIRQILINLLGNSVKFTTRGWVVLRVTKATLDGRPALDFSVEDTGPGIPAEMVDHLFKPFTQVDSKLNRPFEGTGLGLAISLRLAEAMGGTILLTSTPDKGSTFTLRLPCEFVVPPGVAAEGSQQILDAGAKKVRAQKSGGIRPDQAAPVLVVEDDSSSSMLAGRMLERLGYRAEFAADGQRAFEVFAPGKYSAILMDMQMPVMDGLEATQKIREIETGERVPIIALTANVLPGDRERCLAAGMDEFLTKPFKVAELSEMLSRILHGTVQAD